jgi:hypothetical protein
MTRHVKNPAGARGLPPAPAGLGSATSGRTTSRAAAPVAAGRRSHTRGSPGRPCDGTRAIALRCAAVLDFTLKERAVTLPTIFPSQGLSA